MGWTAAQMVLGDRQTAVCKCLGHVVNKRRSAT